MKKTIFFLIILISANGFSQFGINVNYSSYTMKMSYEGLSVDESYDGFGVGLDYAFELGATTLVAALNADFLSEEGDSETVITPSAVIRYPIAETINLRGGLALVNWPDAEDPIKGSLLHLPLGLDFKASDKVSIIAKYSIALGDRLDGDGKVTDNNVSVGLHYKL